MDASYCKHLVEDMNISITEIMSLAWYDAFAARTICLRPYSDLVDVNVRFDNYTLIKSDNLPRVSYQRNGTNKIIAQS